MTMRRGGGGLVCCRYDGMTGRVATAVRVFARVSVHLCDHAGPGGRGSCLWRDQVRVVAAWVTATAPSATTNLNSKCVKATIKVTLASKGQRRQLLSMMLIREPGTPGLHI